MLSERSQTLRDKYCMRCLEQANPETESRIEVPRGWEEGGIESYCSMDTVSVWDDKIVLEMDSSNGYTTM